jgi:hypothetical protein
MAWQVPEGGNWWSIDFGYWIQCPHCAKKKFHSQYLYAEAPSIMIPAATRLSCYQYRPTLFYSWYDDVQGFQGRRAWPQYCQACRQLLSEYFLPEAPWEAVKEFMMEHGHVLRRERNPGPLEIIPTQTRRRYFNIHIYWESLDNPGNRTGGSLRPPGYNSDRDDDDTQVPVYDSNQLHDPPNYSQFQTYGPEPDPNPPNYGSQFPVDSSELDPHATDDDSQFPVYGPEPNPYPTEYDSEGYSVYGPQHNPQHSGASYTQYPHTWREDGETSDDEDG